MNVQYQPGPNGEHPMYASPFPPKKHRIWPWALVAVVLALCGFGAIAALSPSSSPKAADHWDVGLASPAASPKVAKAKEVPGVAEGTWKVGSDVKAGKYTTAGAEDSVITLCYWEVRAGSETGDIQAQGATDKVTAKEYVTLKSGQYFKTSGCKPWTAAHN